MLLILNSDKTVLKAAEFVGTALHQHLNIRVPTCTCECGSSHKFVAAESGDVITAVRTALLNYINEQEEEDDNNTVG